MRAWGFVAGQFVLLAALIVLPSHAVGPVLDLPGMRVGGYALFFAGLVLIVVAGLHLGDALTPSPAPKESGSLRTSGLYRWVRHPIYSGVLLVGWGLGLRSQLWVGLALAAALTGWLTAKARYEEGLLTQRYPEYDSYRATTPRFVPHLRRPTP